MSIFKNILNSLEFKCFNNNQKNIIYNYIDHFSNNAEKLKKIFTSILNILNKSMNESIDDTLESYNKEIINDINKNQKKSLWLG